jgi:hypothetical protein
MDTGGNGTVKRGGGQSDPKDILTMLLQFDLDNLPFNRALIG